MRTKLMLVAACIGGLASLALAEEKAQWSYEGSGNPAQWSELSPDFKTCKLGKFQSPINVDTGKAEKSVDAKPIVFAYTSGDAEVVDTGHTIQVNLSAAGAIALSGVEYKLLQFHFHTPSEETFDGKSYPLVAHLVHKSAKGQLAVVAVLFKAGRENTTLKPVFEQLPTKVGNAGRLGSNFNPTDMLPTDRAYYAFMGSLTTPPCSEDVRWQVLRTPVEVSDTQLAAFRKLYKMNARPVQPLNGRKVVVSQ